MAAGEKCSVLCDVACDHAHVPIWLLQHGKIQKAVCMDIIPGPMEKAKENLRKYGMEDRAVLLLSDGLDAYTGELGADQLLISGLGGMMISEILLREPGKTHSFNSLVLQPQSDAPLVRRTLHCMGAVITDEALVEEEGKFYPVIKAVFQSERKDCGGFPECSGELSGENSKGEFTAEELYGAVLLQRKDSTLKKYLERGLQKNSRILSQLPEGECGGKRMEFLRGTDRIREALRYWESD